MLEFKKLTGADKNNIYDLYQEASDYYELIGEDQPDLESVSDDLVALPPGRTLDDKHFCGIFADERIIGVCDLIEGYPDDDTLYIGLLVLGKQYRHNGYGTEIMNQIEIFAKSKNKTKLELGVHDANKPGRRFWNKSGFKWMRDTEVNGEPVSVMAKNLNNN